MPGGRPVVPGVWLLDLVVDGHAYRYATEHVAIDTDDGDAVVYQEGLVEPSLTYGSVLGVGDASVAIELQAEEDWALLVERGHVLDRAPAVLRRWYPGRTLERARVVIRGLVDAPVYGELGEPLTMSIVRSMREQSRTIPPAQAVVDAATWPVAGTYSVPEKARGAAYPLVIGCPGTTEQTTPVCVVPVPQAQVAPTIPPSHVVWLGGHAAQVRLQRAHLDPPTESTVATTSIADLLGRTVARADTNEVDAEGEYLVGFRDHAAWGGGIEYRGELLRGAGSVIEWALREHYDGPVDYGRLAAVRAYLDAWKIDTYLNSPVSAWDWLSREVLPLLPVEMREGANGVYPALIRYDLTRSDAVAHLDATQGRGRVARAGPVSCSSASIANEVAVEYRPAPGGGSRWLGRVIVTAQAGALSGSDAATAADDRIIASNLAAESQRRYGVRPLRVQASAVWDTTTAVRTARSVLGRRGRPSRSVRYVGGPWLEDLEIGAAVTVTDPGVHLSDALAVVYDVQPGAESAVDLVLVDDPLQRRRPT